MRLSVELIAAERIFTELAVECVAGGPRCNVAMHEGKFLQARAKAGEPQRYIVIGDDDLDPNAINELIASMTLPTVIRILAGEAGTAQAIEHRVVKRVSGRFSSYLSGYFSGYVEFRYDSNSGRCCYDVVASDEFSSGTGDSGHIP
ncbi:MAG: hypothetical protein FLDDKLPJ_00708 [Phycisphaerae bacterium]|nr:hypothetical protein [Phycisphaerae bacterium]